MSRVVTVAAAQMGPIARSASRASVVDRMIALLTDAHGRGAELVVFPELTLTTFFPRWYLEDEAELDSFYETEMPNDAVRPLFETATRLGLAFSLGYAELVLESGGSKRRYNTSIVVDKTGRIIGKYRKIHLPGHVENESWRPFQHLEKRYFEMGDLGFPTFDGLGGVLGMCICNDRRWPETFRVLGLGGVEILMVGYNTPVHYPPLPAHDHLQEFHNHLCLQAGAYQNGTWVVGVAKAGHEEGCDLIGGSCIIAPTGEIVVQAKSVDDELILASCDLERCDEIKKNIFNFDLHRQPSQYSAITAQQPNGSGPRS